MFKKIVLAIAIVLLSKYCSCQIAQEKLLNIKNYVQAELIRQRLESKKSNSSLIQIIRENNKIEKPISFDDLEKKLSADTLNNAITFLKNLNAVKVDTSLKQEEFIETYLSNIRSKVETDTTGNYEAVISGLKNKLTAYITNPETPSIKGNDNGKPKVDSSANIPLPIIDSFFSFSNINIWTLVPCIFLLFIFIWLSMKFGQIDERLKRRVKKEDIGDYPPKVDEAFMAKVIKQAVTEYLGQDLNKLISNSSEIGRITNSIQKLEKELSKLNNDLTETGNKPPSNSSTTPFNSEDIFYMMSPVDNYFYEPYKILNNKESIYKFNVKPNKKEAEFEIYLNSVRITDVLNNSESYIKPACNEDNLPNSNTSSIRTTKNGQVFLEGEKWIIKTKAEIKYE